MTILFSLYNIKTKEIETLSKIDDINFVTVDFVSITYSWCGKNKVDSKELEKLGIIIKTKFNIDYIWIDQLCINQPPNFDIDHHTYKDFYLNCTACIICPSLSGADYDFGFERWKKSRWTPFEVYYSQQKNNRCYIISKKGDINIYNDLKKDFPNWKFK